MGKKGYIGLLLVFLFAISSRAEEEKDIFSFEVNYKGDILSNTLGGIDQGVTYLGYAAIGAGLSTDNVGWWMGGNFHLKGANTHGGEPSSSMIGDLHIVDNIEAGNHTFLQELWFRQSFSDLIDVTVGLQDLNADFAASEETGIYLHSSLGINTVLSGNVSVPIFPLMGLGIQAGWNISDRWRWQICLFDGKVTDFEENPYNVKWKINKEEGYLSCSELHYKIGDDATYKVGGYYHSGAEKYGVYVIGEHRVRSVGLFGQVAWAPKSKNERYVQIDAGFNLHDVFAKEKGDVLGLAFISNLLDNEREHETIIEMTYRYPVLSKLYIQPDVQYVINPAGCEQDVDNALVAILRIELEF